MPILDDYGTHQPFLRAIAEKTPIRTVLEMGAGKFSTPTFLDRGAYPDLEQLISIETVEEWADLSRTNDPRHVMLVVEDECDEIHAHPDWKFDLAFVDGPAYARKYVIGEIAPLGKIVVVHDAENPWYQDAIMKSYEYVYFFAAFWKAAKEHASPWTAICTNDREMSEVIATINASEMSVGTYA